VAAMGDDFSERNPSDSKRVNLDERWERSYWARRFDVTDEELKEAVATVGPFAEDVRRYLVYRMKL